MCKFWGYKEKKSNSQFGNWLKSKKMQLSRLVKGGRERTWGAVKSQLKSCVIYSGTGGNSQKAACAGVGCDESGPHSPISECKRSSENSRRKHNEAANWDRGTPSDSHLSLNIQSIGKLSSLFSSSGWARRIVAGWFSCYQVEENKYFFPLSSS